MRVDQKTKGRERELEGGHEGKEERKNVVLPKEFGLEGGSLVSAIVKGGK